MRNSVILVGSLLSILALAACDGDGASSAPGETGATMTFGAGGLGGGEGDAHAEDGVSATFVELTYAEAKR